MIRINLIPPSERASLKVVRPTILFVVLAALVVAALTSATVYLRWQIANEKSRLASYKDTVAAVGRYRREQASLEQKTRELVTLANPLEEELAARQPALDLELLLSRAASKAAGSNVWLRELILQRDGALSMTGYAVEFGDVSRFLTAVGQDPFTIQSSSTEWVERDGARLLGFSARIAAVKGGAEP
jgi:hypothetical protein